MYTSIFFYVVLLLAGVILLFPQWGHSQSLQETLPWYSYSSPHDTPYIWAIYVQPGGQVFSTYNSNWFSSNWAYRWGVGTGSYQPEQNYNGMLNYVSSLGTPYIPYSFPQNPMTGAQPPSGYDNSTYAYPPSMEGFYFFSPYPGAVIGSSRSPEAWYESLEETATEYIRRTGIYVSQPAANIPGAGLL